MKTAILGSGGGALAVAADLARGGREAVLADLPEFAANLDAVREQGGVKVSTGWLGLQQETVEVAPSIEDAVDGARLIVVVVPCFGHEPFMTVLAPLLVSGQSLLFLGEGSGSIVARRALAVREAEGVVTGETNTLPFLARPVRPGVVTADRKTGGVLLAATPSSDTAGLLELVSDVWPYVTPTGSVWDTVLINYNAIDHVATMLANAGTLEARAGGMLLWGEGATPSVVRLVEALDAELFALRGALGGTDPRRYRDFLIAQGLAPDVGDLYAVMRAGGITRSVRPSGGPEDLVARLDLEVPWSLVLASSIGEAVGLATPVIDGLIDVAGTMLARDVRAEGRTLTTLGLGGLDADRLRAYAAGDPFSS